jgi:hypothetical protein
MLSNTLYNIVLVKLQLPETKKNNYRYRYRYIDIDYIVLWYLIKDSTRICYFIYYE